MPRPTPENIGTCPCSSRACREIAKVRKMKNKGFLYLHCVCGTDNRTSKVAQDYILNNASMYGGEHVPEPVPDAGEPVPDKTDDPTSTLVEQVPDGVPEPKPKKTDWDLDDL